MPTTDCPDYEFVRKKLLGSDEDLEKTRSRILNVLSKRIGIDLTDAQESIEYVIYDKTSKKELWRLPSRCKIYQVTPEIMRWGLEKDPNLINGYYDVKQGRIFLNSTRWCLHTFIHESLHSVSNFSRTYQTLPCQEFPCEGINELLTGYVLCILRHDIKDYAAEDCYQGWKKYCFLPRLRANVMMFYFISAKIGMQEMLSISLDPTITNPLSRLAQSIQKQVNFENIFEKGWNVALIGQRYLKDELASCYGEEFSTFMNQGLPILAFPPKI